MGKETIFYYVTEESITGCKKTMKLRFFQRLKFTSFIVEDNDITIVTFMIPNLSKKWNREKLLRLMQKSIAEHPLSLERPKIMMQPQVQQLLGQSDDFLPIFWSLSQELLATKFKPAKKRLSATDKMFYPNYVVLLLGDVFFLEEQLEKFSEMMQPYFPYMNHLVILYDTEEDKREDVSVEHVAAIEAVAETDMRSDIHFSQESERLEELLDEYADALYYEYGLVSQIQCGRDFVFRQQNRGKEQNLLLFLDYGYMGALPLRVLREGGVYLDVLSSPKKEALIRQKCTEISYLSPRKYLDTVVKSGYYKLVN